MKDVFFPSYGHSVWASAGFSFERMRQLSRFPQYFLMVGQRPKRWPPSAAPPLKSSPSYRRPIDTPTHIPHTWYWYWPPLLSTNKQFPLSKLNLLASRKEKQRRSLVADQHIRRENSNEMTWIELNFVDSFIWKTSGKLRQWKFQLVNSMKVKKRIRKRRKDFEWGTTSADPRAGNWPKLIERPCLFDAEASLACGRSNIQWKIKKRLQRRTGEPDRAAHRQVSRWRFHFAAKKS